jgi:hypothetical protein
MSIKNRHLNGREEKRKAKPAIMTEIADQETSRKIPTTTSIPTPRARIPMSPPITPWG